MTFDALVDAAVGTAADTFDVRATIRRCYFYDFDGYPTRLWNGVGVLHAGGYDWIGTVAPGGMDFHTVPVVTDPRDGTSPRYSFGIPYLDKATFDVLRADRDLVSGRALTCYRVIIVPGEGLRPATALKFAWAMTMQEATFAERYEGAGPNAVKVYSASVLARSSEVGRSRVPGGTYTDTAQRERARILGVTADSFCAFVASNARRTLTIEGG